VTKPRGRPSTFNKKIADIIVRLAGEGKTEDEIAKLIGVGKQTLYNWRAAQPDFRDAVKNAKAVADQLVMASLFSRACGYSQPSTKFFLHNGQVIREEYIENFPPDVTACIFWLKNRQPRKWRDTFKIDSETAQKPIGVTYQPKTLREVKPCS
jgi:hypothetical protein